VLTSARAAPRSVGELFGRSPLAGIELGRRRSREVRRPEHVVVSAVVLARLRPALWPHTPDLTPSPATRPNRPISIADGPGRTTSRSSDRWDTDAVVEGKGVARLRQVPRQAAYRCRPAEGSSHSSVCERPRRAASRARTAARRDFAASSLRPARSSLSACASASAALSSSAAAVRLSHDRCAAHIRASSHRAAAWGAVRRDGGRVPARLLEVPLLRWHTVAPLILSDGVPHVSRPIPISPNWKAGQLHPAYLLLSTSLDHVEPGARGGSARESRQRSTPLRRRGGRTAHLGPGARSDVTSTPRERAGCTKAPAALTELVPARLRPPRCRGVEPAGSPAA
jgi:hypothetical protein